MSAGAQTDTLFPTFERIGSRPDKYKTGFINRTGLRVVDPRFDYGLPFRCGLSPVKRGKVWGAIDGSGKLVIEPISHSPLVINEDRIVYSSANGKLGVMNLDGQIVIKPSYRILVGFQEGVSWMSVDRLYGFVTTNGQQLAAPMYEDARSFSDGVAPVKLGGKWGYIDKFLEFRIPPQFDFALPFSEGLARVENAGLWGYINQNGKYVISPQYVAARDFHQGMAEVEVGNLWGYIDHNGEIVVKLAFRRTSEFVEGVAAVAPHDHPNGHYGFINREGIYVIPPQYEMVGTFRHGLCFVELADEVAYVDHDGDVIWRGPYVDVGRISEL